MVCKLNNSNQLTAKQEAQWQIKRWKTSLLTKSRKHYWEEVRKRPWISNFYKALLTSAIEKHNSKMLDVGCGTGFFAKWFGHDLIPSNKLSEIVGVDLNRKLLERAKKEEDELRRPKSSRRIEMFRQTLIIFLLDLICLI